MKIFTVAHVPEELHKAWLQHLRDFDTAHPGCHFEVMADAPKATMMEMIEVLSLNPGLSFSQIIERRAEPVDVPEAEWSCGHIAGAVCAECHRQLILKANALAAELNGDP